jgi:uncharacterized protein
MVKDFHHFKGKELSRSEKIQKKVVQLILNMNDNESESSIIWELKHSAGCCQIGRILALKRGLDIELAEIISILHDIYAIINGKYKDHAKKGAIIAQKMLEESNEFSDKEIEIIVKAIEKHSQKEIYSDDPYVELAKDVDVLDCSLYENSENYYIIHKPNKIYQEYKTRVTKVRKELGIKGSFRK